MLIGRRGLIRNTAFATAAILADAGMPGSRREIARAATLALRDAAADKGIRYGAWSAYDVPEAGLPGAPAAYRQLLLDQCALYAPSMSWNGVSPQRGVHDYSRRESTTDFAVDHGLRLTGLHLFWHLGIPDWFVDLNDTADIEAAMVDRAQSMMAHYRGFVFAWNVVNEALFPRDGLPDYFRRSPLYDKLGPDFVRVAFEAARDQDPHALLVYNEIDVERDVREHEQKRVGLLRLLDRLQKANAPIQAVGLQSHLFRFNGYFNDDRYRAFLHEISSRGLKIILSELDVSDVDLPADIAIRDQAVADIYRRYLDVCLDDRAVIAVVTWGLSDSDTWLTPASGEQFRRPDGLPERPLPFDVDLKPKPAYFAILQAFQNAPPRDA